MAALSLAVGVLLAGQAGAVESYRFGIVPQFEPRKLAAIWTPILRALEERTAIGLRMVGSPRIPVFETAFLAGAFDFAYMNPYHAMLAARHQGYLPLVRDGGRKLVGIVVVRKDSAIAGLGQLAGATIAFPAPNALGASLVVRAALDARSVADFSPLYVQTHSSVYLHVAMGLARAGGGVLSTLRRQPARIRDRLKIVYRSAPMPPHPVMAHPRVPAAVREKIRRAFIGLGQTLAGRAMLARVPIREVAAAAAGDYAMLGEMGLERYYRPGD